MTRVLKRVVEPEKSPIRSSNRGSATAPLRPASGHDTDRSPSSRPRWFWHRRPRAAIIPVGYDYFSTDSASVVMPGIGLVQLQSL